MANTQRQYFSHLDMDTEQGMMRPGAYRYAFNVHIGSSQSGNTGSVENQKGNTLVNFVLPFGTNEVIGSYEDIEGQQVFYFLYNSFANHGIYKYSIQTNSISQIFGNAILNFNPNYRITGIGLLGNILSWCDDLNPNRAIDLDNILNIAANPSTEELISLIKKPPMFPPTVTRKKDLTYSQNYIVKKFFQFATRYVYVDGSKSVLSPYSMLAVNTLTYSKTIVNRLGTDNKTYPIPVETANPDDNNYLEINLNNSEITTSSAITVSIKNIEFLVREGNDGPWGIFKAMTLADVVLAGGLVNFYNDVNINTIDQTEANRPFDSVPLRSAAHTIAKNRGFWGRNTEGYTIGNNVLAEIIPTYTEISTSLSDVPGTGTTSIVGDMIFKDRGVFNFGVLWKDKYGRNAGVETNASFVANINANTTTFKNVCKELNLQLSGTPPDWAHSYSIVRSKNLNQGYFQTIILTGISYLTGYDEDGNAVYTSTFSEGILETHLTFNAGSYSHTPYVFNEGDQIFIYYKVGSTNYKNTFKIRSLFYGTIDATTEIRNRRPGRVDRSSTIASEAYQEETLHEQQGITTIVLDRVNLGALLTDYAEVFNHTVNDGIFYEIGKVYPVTNPGTPSRSLSTTSIDINNGDSYLIMRPLNKYSAGGSGRRGTTPSGLFVIKNVFIEAMNLFDDFFQQSVSDIGLPTIIVPEAKEESKTSSIRFSNLFVQGSNINGLSSFEGLNEYNLPYEYGIIYSLVVASNTLSQSNVMLAVHSHEITSLYINEVVYSDIAGKTTVGVSNDVIGAARVLRGSYGTIHPDSICQNNGTVYGWDMQKGVVWRYSNDGVNPISDILMKSFFYQLSRDLQGQDIKVLSTFDRFYNEFIITIDDQTVAFNEVDNNWKEFHPFVPEEYQKIGTTIISFKNGQLYRHDSNSTYGNFYGVQYTSQVTPVCNIEPGKSKLLQNVSTESKDKWIAIEIKNPKGQECNLISGDYIKNETGFSANVLRDKNTPNINPPQLPVLHGDEMRDYSFTAKLECSSTSLTTLRSADFKVIESYRND